MRAAAILTVFLITLLLLSASSVQATPAPDAPTTAPPDHFSIDILAQITPPDAELIQESGVQMVRYYFSWGSIQPNQTSAYDWSNTDTILGLLAAHSLGVQAIITGNPGWAATTDNGPVNDQSKAAFLDFVAAAAGRYSHAPYTVRRWEIYNEPDAHENWGLHGADYAATLSQVYPRMKTAATDAQVMIGGLGFDFFMDQGGSFDRHFLSDFLAAGGGNYTDAINFHHYSQSPAWHSLGEAVGAIKTDLANAGVDRPLILSETGAPSDPRYGGSLTKQADYVAQIYAEGLGRGFSNVTWFPLHDFNNPQYGYFQSHGLLTIDGQPKPALTAYQVASRYLGAASGLRGQSAAELGGSSTAVGYSFARGDGTGLLVGWDAAGTATETWPAADVRGVQDVYGAVVPYSVQNGQAVVPLAASPRYIALAVPSRYIDVPFDYWAQPYVEALSARGAISGYSDSTFRPGNSTTRGQLSKILVRAMGWPDNTGAGQVFADVPPGHPFYAAVDTAAAHGIISGYGCGGPSEPCDSSRRPYFRPGVDVTRSQLSKMIVVAKGWSPLSPASGVQDFLDVPPTFALYGFVEAVYQHGVVSGYQDHTFRPGNSSTRAQLAKMTENAIGGP
jgi:hypothetical protein